MNGCEWLLVD